MVSAQGGDPDADLPEASERRQFSADRGGYLVRLDARAVGVAAWRLGAGRARKEDAVNASAGVVALKKPGDEVEAGEPVLELHADDPARFEPAVEALAGAVEIGPDKQESQPMILERIA
jgi:thymidine phosphorylase